MNYISRTRSGLRVSSYVRPTSQKSLDPATSFSPFHSASELEMNAEISQFERFRSARPPQQAMIMSADTETSEIIRRRLLKGSCPRMRCRRSTNTGWLQANRSQIQTGSQLANNRVRPEGLSLSHLSVFEVAGKPGLPNARVPAGRSRSLLPGTR